MDVTQFAQTQIFAVTGGQLAHTTGTALSYALSIFNPPGAAQKNIYIFDLDIEDNSGLPILTVYENLNLPDPHYANVMTPANLGGVANTSNASITNSGMIAQFTPPGNPVMTTLVGSKGYNPLLELGTGFRLPVSANSNGYIISIVIGSTVGTGISYVNFRYGEY